jgi:carbon starvation protein
VWLTTRLPAPELGMSGWNGVLLVYAGIASVLPVWLLLQPRDYLNSLLLYLGLVAIFAGFAVLQPEFAAPAVELHPEGAPPLFPFVFIVIACGAISGFHGLVSSGTTAKQIDKETDATFIGYGGMIGESLLGLSAVLACTAGFLSPASWKEHYATWNAAQGLGRSMSAYIDGSARFLSSLGIPPEAGSAFVALVAVSFALTTLDSATRLLRYNIEEVSETLRLPVLGNRFVATVLAVAAIGFFSTYEIDGRPAGLALWALFGTTNQTLGGLTLLAVTLYLLRRGRSIRYTLAPMVFMLVTSVVAMALNVHGFWTAGQHLLLVVGSALLVLSLWLCVEAALSLSRHRAPPAAGA